MRGLNSACIDLIYLDPPFNSNADYAAPIGSPAEGSGFKDTWALDDIKIEWIDLLKTKQPALHHVILIAPSNSDKAYLAYMAPRLLEMKRLLKPNGSIFLHCDWHMGHYLKVMMDVIFGKANFRNEIVWCYTGPGSPKIRQFNRKHDTIFWYSLGDSWTFNKDDERVRLPHADGGPHAGGFRDENGKIAMDSEVAKDYGRKGKVPESWWAQEPGNGLCIVPRMRKQDTGYKTQKPEALLERIVLAASNRGDMVLDPFCGCATTMVVADREQRDWVGIDMSEKAVELVEMRIRKDQMDPKYAGLGLFEKPTCRSDIPQRTDLGDLPNPKTHKRSLYGEQEGRCEGCTQHFEIHNLEIDHIISKDDGGGDHKDNLQLLCGHCNRVKGNRGMDYLMSKLNMEMSQSLN